MDGVYSQQVIWQTEQQLAQEKLNEARTQADEAKERAAAAEKENQLLKAQEKQTIIDLYNQGVSLQILIHTYHKTPEEIEKIINKRGLDSFS